jgi:hypothetical protein
MATIDETFAQRYRLSSIDRRRTVSSGHGEGSTVNYLNYPDSPRQRDMYTAVPPSRTCAGVHLLCRKQKNNPLNGRIVTSSVDCGDLDCRSASVLTVCTHKDVNPMQHEPVLVY